MTRPLRIEYPGAVYPVRERVLFYRICMILGYVQPIDIHPHHDTYDL